MFTRVKGVADNFLNMIEINDLLKKITFHIKGYNFYPIAIPILEHLNLFERGIGLTTDVVSKEMFILQSKGDDADTKNKICLRPEGTAGTLRAFLEVAQEVALPARVYFYGPMFRYERPQKGRMREFHQFNMEIIGASSILHDAYFIKMLHELFLTTLQIKNSILFINFLGQKEDRFQFVSALSIFLKNHETKICENCKLRAEKNPLRALDCKSERCQEIYKNAPIILDFLSNDSQQEWMQLQKTLNDFKVPFSINHRLVRGLDYYNKTVFEFVSHDLGAQSTLCGGGRYDDLAKQLGSKSSVPALGCAIGIERLMLIAQAQGIHFKTEATPLVCVIPLTTDQNQYALQIADQIIKSELNIRLEILCDDAKIKHKMKQASDLRATFAILIGEDELKNNSLSVKNMINGTQKSCDLATALQMIQTFTNKV